MVGIRTSVTRVETVSPPIMVIPRGFQTSAPTCRDTARGTMPKSVVSVVMSTGLRRCFPAWVTASSSS